MSLLAKIKNRVENGETVKKGIKITQINRFFSNIVKNPKIGEFSNDYSRSDNIRDLTFKNYLNSANVLSLEKRQTSSNYSCSSRYILRKSLEIIFRASRKRNSMFNKK